MNVHFIFGGEIQRVRQVILFIKERYPCTSSSRLELKANLWKTALFTEKENHGSPRQHYLTLQQLLWNQRIQRIIVSTALISTLLIRSFPKQLLFVSSSKNLRSEDKDF
uniref:Uncharacterized protein n=1 Tax=Lepeophtheirus salmonis TaxID=72036 RepID=A0A0K2VIK5_LEPSM